MHPRVRQPSSTLVPSFLASAAIHAGLLGLALTVGLGAAASVDEPESQTWLVFLQPAPGLGSPMDSAETDEPFGREESVRPAENAEPALVETDVVLDEAPKLVSVPYELEPLDLDEEQVVVAELPDEVVDLSALGRQSWASSSGADKIGFGTPLATDASRGTSGGTGGARGASSASAVASSFDAGPLGGLAGAGGAGGGSELYLVRVPPVKIAGADPEYPPLSVRLGEEGVVVCLLHVDAEGAVTRVEVEQSSGYERLDDAAVERLRTWRFRAGTLGGTAVASTYRHRIRFELG